MKFYFKQSVIFIIAAMITFALSFTVGTKISAATVRPDELKQTGETTTSVSIEWNSPYSTNRTYHVELSTDNVNWTESKITPSTSTSLNYLEAGHTYYVRIYTTDLNNNNPSAYSDVLEVVTKPLGSLTLVQSAATSNSVTLSWNPIEGANQYQIYYQNASDSYGTQKQLIGTTQACNYTLTNFSAYSDKIYLYVYAARTTSNNQYAAVSEVAFGSINNIRTIPAKVTGCKKDYWTVSNKGNDNTLRVSWTSVPNVSGYQVKVYNTNKKCVATYTTSSNKQIITKLSKTSCYYFKVRSYVMMSNTPSYGEWSSKKWVLPAGTGSISRKNNKLYIKWNKVTGATGYDVYMKVSGASKYKKVKSFGAAKTTCTISKFNGKKLSNVSYTVTIVTKKKVGTKTYTSK